MGDEIKKLDTDLYLVHGRVIGSADPGMFDADTPEGRAVLIDVADNTCGSPMCPGHDDPLAAFLFTKAAPQVGGRFFMASLKHFRELPAQAREILRKEFPDHADEF